MSAPRSATETKTVPSTVPSGGRPIVSTVSAQTAGSRVWGVTPLGGRAQIVWVGEAQRCARGQHGQTAVSQEPGAAVVADAAGPLERAMRQEIEDRVVLNHEDRDRGEPRGSAPPTPPYVRARIRRFGGLR